MATNSAGRTSIDSSTTSFTDAQERMTNSTPRASFTSDTPYVDANQSQATLGRPSQQSMGLADAETTEVLRPSVDASRSPEVERPAPLQFSAEPTATVMSMGAATTQAASDATAVHVPASAPENLRNKPALEDEAGRVLAAADEEKQRRSADDSSSKASKVPAADEVEADPLAGFSEEARAIIKAQADVPKPRKLSYFALFKYGTRFEIAANIVAVGCAIAAGAAQPLMTLVSAASAE